MSGYEIKEMINDNISHFWSESLGQIYPALKWLLNKGFISLHEDFVGKRKRHIYSMTNKGLIFLQNWLKEKSEEKSTHRDEELLKLFFSNNSSKDNILKLLKKREEKCLLKLSNYHSIEKAMKHHRKSSQFPFWLATLKNGIIHLHAEIKWCRATIKYLRKY